MQEVFEKKNEKAIMEGRRRFLRKKKNFGRQCQNPGKGPKCQNQFPAATAAAYICAAATAAAAAAATVHMAAAAAEAAAVLHLQPQIEKNITIKSK